MKKRSKIQVGYLSIGSYKKYTACYAYNPKGQRHRIDVPVSELPDLGPTRHPSIKKVEKFLNTDEGIVLLEKLSGHTINIFER